MASGSKTKPLVAERCHNCRRRRLRCDRSVPSCQKCIKAGQECLGYGKLFRWNQGIASRGKMMGKSFDIPAQSKVTTKEPISESTLSTLVPVPRHRTSGYEMHNFVLCKSKSPDESNPGILISPCLLDPLVQDMRYSSRYYLSHFAGKLTGDLVTHDVPDHNPYRSLIALTKDHPHLLYIIIANSAIYLSNTFTDPMGLATGSTLTLAKFSLEDKPQPRNERSSRAFRDALMAKQKALQLLRQELDNFETMGREVVLTTMLLSINFELVASGKDEWKVHVEGARKLIDYFHSPSRTGSPMGQLRDYATADCLIYYVLGSAFLSVKSRAKTAHHSRNVLPMLKRAEANSYMSCPSTLLQVVLLASHLSDQQRGLISEAGQNPSNSQAEEAWRLMERAKSFDVSAWAECVQGISSHNDFESRLHIAMAHKSAVCLYINRAVPIAKLLDERGIEILVQNIIDNLSPILPGDPLLKGTCWPTFMAGAECVIPERQSWIVSRMHVLWEILPWGYIRNALQILREIWGLKSNPNPMVQGVDGWLQEMKALEKEWIVV